MDTQTRDDDRLRAAAQETRDASYDAYLAQDRSRDAALTFSKVRENALAWYPFVPDARMLEARCGSGAVTGCLLRARPAHLDALATTHRGATISATRYGAYDALSLLTVNEDDIADAIIQLAEEEAYDYIVIHDLTTQDAKLLSAAYRALAPDGHLLVTAANALSYRELAAPRLTDKVSATRVSRMGLVSMLRDAGFSEMHLWYPHPDHLFARQLFSDERPPEAGELTCHADPEGAARIAAHDEEQLVRSFAQEGAFAQVAGGFLVDATEGAGAAPSNVTYAKVSHERRRKLALVTTIEQGDEGPIVRKRALYPEGKSHLAAIPTWCDSLGTQLKGHFVPNRATLEDDGSLQLEFLSGPTLEDMLTECIATGRDADARQLLDDFRNRLEACSQGSFQVSDKIRAIFGSQNLPGELEALEGLPTFATTDIDLIFRNVIVDGNGTWHLIDYEWTFDLALPVLYVLWRALRHLLESESVRARERELGLWEAWGLDKQLCDTFFGMEMSFQWYVHGREPLPIDELLQSGVAPRLNPKELLEQTPDKRPSLARRVAHKLLGR